MIDIGVNLTHESFRDDLDEVILQAKNSGITDIIITGADLEHSLKAREIAESYEEGVYFTAGLHPNRAEQEASSVEEIFKITSQKLKAWGEMGLDYHRQFSSREIQKEVFDKQLKYSFIKKLPLFLHDRDAFEDFYHILSSHKNNLDRFVVHCFTGSFEALRSYLDLGAYIGITGWVCDKRGEELRDLLKFIPLDRLMIETDAPYLSPNKIRRNEPKFLPEILGKVSTLLSIDKAELEIIFDQNTKYFFDI